MLSQGLIHVIGSDCHNLDSRPPNLDVALRFLAERGEDTLLPQLIEFNRFVLHGAIPLDKAMNDSTERA